MFCSVFFLSVVAEDLLNSSEQVMEDLLSICDAQSLLSLLRTPCLRSRITILRILEVLFEDSPMRLAFETIQGFPMMGAVLQTFVITEEMFAILLSMLLGKPLHKSKDGNPPINLNFFLGPLNDDVTPAVPGMIVTILMLLNVEHRPSDLAHSVLKILHGLFLQSEVAKDLFLKNDLIRLLCDILYLDVRQKSNVDGSQVHDDIFAFLKEIAMFGCTTGIGVALVDDIITVSFSLIIIISLSFFFSLLTIFFFFFLREGRGKKKTIELSMLQSSLSVLNSKSANASAVRRDGVLPRELLSEQR
jgi:hypothetical protein